MSQNFPESYLLQRTFDDVDDLNMTARQWDNDFRQLDRGRFHGKLLQFGMQGVHIVDCQFDRALKQVGTPPVGLRTVAVPANPDFRCEWRGHSIDGQSLMIFPRGSELSSISAPGFHAYACSFPEELLSAVGESLEVGGMDELCGGAEAIRIEAATASKLSECLHRVCQSVRDKPTALSSAALRSQLTHNLPSTLLRALAAVRGKCPAITGPKRLATLARAEKFIEQNAFHEIGVGDICEATGVSERTLQYAFIQKFGMGPKEYLNAFRLFLVRRQLRAADPRKTKVADVANECGFWHMGQFAADYRERFEELPSQTLRSRNSG